MTGARLAVLLERAADAIEDVEATTDKQWGQQTGLAELLRHAAESARSKGAMALDVELTLHRVSRIRPLVATRPARRKSWSSET